MLKNLPNNSPQLKGKIIAGMDEVGRGAWAGPVVSAVVILPRGCQLAGLNDSKKITAKKRDELYEKIVNKAKFGVGKAHHHEVDKHGLTHATFLSFQRALKNLEEDFPNSSPDHLLIDGRDPFHFKIPHTSIIKGDGKIRSIAAASILAKVTRDRIMQSYNKTLPQYSFGHHKGYGTKRHQRALLTHGPSKIHRFSYAPIKAILNQQDSLFTL
jgi:ribonuclease HII